MDLVREKEKGLQRQQKRTSTGTLSASWSRYKITETVLNNGWRLMAVGSWGWWLVAVGDWRLMAAGDGWRLAVSGWWRLAVGGGWRLAVGGWWPLRAVLKETKIGVLKDSLDLVTGATIPTSVEQP